MFFFCLINLNDWSKYIPWVEYAQNSMTLSTIVSNHHWVTNHHCSHGTLISQVYKQLTSRYVVNRSEQVWENAHQRLKKATATRKWFADRVWLSTQDLRGMGGCKKINAQYIGPFKISKQINPVSFHLELPYYFRINPTFHVSLLKPVTLGPLDEPPAPLNIEGEPAYIIKDILRSRRRAGHLEYLVDWEGYGPEEQSWVQAKDIFYPLLIQDFHNRRSNQPELALGDIHVRLLYLPEGALWEGVLLGTQHLPKEPLELIQAVTMLFQMPPLPKRTQFPFSTTLQINWLLIMFRCVSYCAHKHIMPQFSLSQC